jgi:hypothetical protein
MPSPRSSKPCNPHAQGCEHLPGPLPKRCPHFDGTLSKPCPHFDGTLPSTLSRPCPRLSKPWKPHAHHCKHLPGPCPSVGHTGRDLAHTSPDLVQALPTHAPTLSTRWPRSSKPCNPDAQGFNTCPDLVQALPTLDRTFPKGPHPLPGWYPSFRPTFGHIVRTLLKGPRSFAPTVSRVCHRVARTCHDLAQGSTRIRLAP